MAFESGPDEPELVTIQTFTNQLEADIAKGALDAFGIDCMISRDDAGGQRPHLAFSGGMRLMVRAEDAERAAEVLRTDTAGA